MAIKNGRPTKVIHTPSIWTEKRQPWCVYSGELKRLRGRPTSVENLFVAVAEKIPFAALVKVRNDLRKRGISSNGIYIAHDSMGFPRYVGRGQIFTRLSTRFRNNREELRYFSFYVVKEKKHEREIETLIIRVAGPLLELNDRKKRLLTAVGSMADYERGTSFYERQRKKGRNSKK